MYKILAILLTCSVLVGTAIVFLPATTQDSPRPILFDKFLHEGEFFAYDLWVDAGDWIIIEIFSEVQTRIRVETWVESERATHRLGNSVDSHGVFMLKESAEGRYLYILLCPLLDGNVRAEIIDSSFSIASTSEANSVQFWYLFLLLAAILVDGNVGVSWLQARRGRGREHEAIGRRKDFDSDIWIPRSYRLISLVRNLIAKQDATDVE